MSGEVLRVDEVLAVLQVPALDAYADAFIGDALEVLGAAGRRVGGSDPISQLGRLAGLVRHSEVDVDSDVALFGRQ